jgi:hypothetical protein
VPRLPRVLWHDDSRRFAETSGSIMDAPSAAKAAVLRGDYGATISRTLPVLADGLIRLFAPFHACGWLDLSLCIPRVPARVLIRVSLGHFSNTSTPFSNDSHEHDREGRDLPSRRSRAYRDRAFSRWGQSKPAPSALSGSNKSIVYKILLGHPSDFRCLTLMNPIIWRGRSEK